MGDEGSADQADALRALLDAVEAVGSGEGITRSQVEAASAEHRPLLEKLRLLHEERLFLEQIVENIPNMIFVKEAKDLRFVRFNRAGEELLGYRREDLLGKSDHDFFPPDEAKFFINKDREVLAGGVVQDIPEEPIHTRLKGERWLHTQKIPVIDADGNVLYLLGISEDITERKEALAALAQSQERLAAERLQARLLEAQKLESLGVMAGGIAHDFNNLLVGILGNNSLALMDLAREHPARPALDMVEKSARVASDLTRQLLAYSGRGKFLVEKLDVSRLVREMAALLEVTISQRATLRMELDDDLPPVEADPVQMRQLVLNLITNAVDAVESVQGGTITISTEVVDVDEGYMESLNVEGALKPGRSLALEVCDNGHGMEEETRHRMFDPFFTTKEQGHGLGLAAALGIVKGHRGGLKVYSEVGMGTTIKVILPLAEGTATTASPRPASQVDLTGRRIMIVDDEEVVRDFARRVLDRAGMDVVSAADGDDALELYDEGMELVLLDMTMPRVSGSEVYSRLRARNPEVRVLLSSGHNQAEATRRFSGKGLAGFLQKPYGAGELLAKIQELLGA